MTHLNNSNCCCPVTKASWHGVVTWAENRDIPLPRVTACHANIPLCADIFVWWHPADEKVAASNTKISAQSGIFAWHAVTRGSGMSRFSAHVTTPCQLAFVTGQQQFELFKCVILFSLRLCLWIWQNCYETKQMTSILGFTCYY
jgi:hypothetical protein